MSLILWTGADAKALKEIVGPAVAQGGCKHRVVADVTKFPEHAGPADVVLGFGSKAVATLQALGLVPKNRTIGSLREKPIKHNGTTVFVTYDPNICYRDYARQPEVQWDIQLASRLHQTGSTKPQIGEYRYVESLHELIERIEEKYEQTKKQVDLACDLETKSLNPYDPAAWIISASFTVDEGKSDVLYFERGEAPVQPLPWKSEDDLDYWEGLWTQIHWILTTDKVSLRGANFKYDSTWIHEKWGIYCTNHRFDTMLVGSLLDENRCVAPETLILTSDLRWVRADSLQSGDSVVGFDEHGDQGIHRRMRKSLVSSSEVIKKRRLKLNLSNGHSIVVSDNHQFLCKKYPSTHVKVWRKAKNIQPGCVIFSATPHPKDIQGEASDYELGRLSGFLDGEGSVPKLNDVGSWHLGWGQIPHSAHQDMKRVASLIKAEYREHDDNLNLCKSVVFKGAWNSLHALIATRPLRLVAKEPWDNGPLPRGDEAVSVSVLSVEDLGVGPVVALETTTHTFIAEGLLSHNSNSLKLHAKLMTPMGGYEDDMDKYDFGSLEVVPKSEMLNYVGGDTDATYRVAIKMKADLLGDKRLTNFYVKLLHPASKAFEKMERNGVLVDVPYYHQLQTELEAEIARLQSEMLKCMPNKMRIKYKDDIQGAFDEGKSPFKPSILKEFLFTQSGLNLKPQVFTEKTGEPSTSMDHLMMFESDPIAANFISLFRELGSASKTLSTYVIGFLKHLRPDNRFHATYMLHRGGYGGGDSDSGTVTGRCLTAEARILTDKGEIPIKELVERGEQGEAFKVLTHKNRWLPVTGYWRNGVKPVCTVKASGRQLTSTYNHPYMSFPSWTLAEDLKLGAWLYSVVEPPKVEEWRPIAGWPFEVSNMGRVRRAIDGHGVVAGQGVPSRAKGIWGHRMVSLTKFDNGREKIDVPVHKLVADAFLTNKGGVEIAHLNGDAACNWSTNLKWVSVEENKLHFRLHGNAQHDNQKKLDWETVDALRAGMWGNNHQAAEALGVSRELVRDVRLFKKWNGRRDSMTGFMPIRVDSVKDAGVQETFDLTVDEDHSFIANGLVVHNTSAKDPAVQCLPRWVKVLTTDGYKPILEIVEGVERGDRYKVVTHDGSWRDVIGVYRNGVQPLFKVTLASGHSITCTGNHPLLTSAGFVRADKIALGGTCYVINSGAEVWEASGTESEDPNRSAEPQVRLPMRLRGSAGLPCVEPVRRADKILRVLEGGVQQDAWAHDAHDAEQNLYLLEEHSEAVLLGEPQLVQELRGVGDQGLREVAHLRELSGRHGRDAGRPLHRETGPHEGLRAGELRMDSAQQAESQQTEHGAADVQRKDSGAGGLVGGNGTPPLGSDLESKERVEYGSGPHHAEEAVRAGYLASAITCIERVEPEETFDLTIEGSHSFVANGVVVHNTVPKHSKWAKRLRRAYIAPPGKVIIQCDFSQGELRICAVVAEEPIMTQAYASGADLHAITAAQLNGYTFEDFMLLPEDTRDALRSGGKAGNFGLIYGMQHKGFRDYAYTTYGVSMTEEEAFQKRESFFGLYNRLPAWHDEYKEHAHRWGFVRSPLGRVRHLPLINSKDREVVAQSERQAINSPIQSCLSDMMQLAMVHIDREYGDADIQMFMMTHDSLALYCPEDDAIEWARRIKYIMENLPLERDFWWSSPLKFIADAEVSVADADGVHHLAGLKKLKGL